MGQEPFDGTEHHRVDTRAMNCAGNDGEMQLGNMWEVAIYHSDAAGLPWRELPSAFGSSPTLARRHRQMMVNGS